MITIRVDGFSREQKEFIGYIVNDGYRICAEGETEADITLWCADTLPDYAGREDKALVIASKNPKPEILEPSKNHNSVFLKIPFERSDIIRALDTVSSGIEGGAHKCCRSTGLETILKGRSVAMADARRTLALFAKSDEHILILGESGTGKELAARGIHGLSARANDPFVSVNCGAFQDTLLDAELFGTVRGAFTGSCDRPGMLESSGQGTLFLDEIGELSASGQTRFLRVLETREYSRVGETRTRSARSRIVAATNANLGKRVGKKTFRLDLFHRLNALVTRLPPLRERMEDIADLCHAFLGQEMRSRLTEGAIARLMSHDWPGNVRELRNVLKRADILAEGKTIGERYVEFH